MAKPAFTLQLPKRFSPEKRGEHWFWEVDGRELRLSNLTKVFWPREGYTKGDLVAAYLNLADHIVPHLRDRPLTMVRMPDGIEGHYFYEKQAPEHRPDWVPTAPIPSEDRTIDYVLVQDTATLLYCANLGCIEMHPLHSRAQTYAFPDYLFFDLDPFPPITFAQVRRAALMVKVALDRLGIHGYPKTSGATGMQVYVPLDGTYTYDEARAFTERVCRIIHRTWPEGTTMEWEIAKRSGKVFLDYGMVREGANIATVYSIRPRPGMPISTPLRWEEVEQDIEPSDFDITNIFERLEREGDLFAPVLTGGTPKGQSISDAMEALGLPRPEERTPPEREPERPATRRRPARRRQRAPESGEEVESALGEYRRKRHFQVTPEPAGESGARMSRATVEAAPGQSFVIHKHHARRLHYDLRLERGGVLVSWAVPKGLPEEPGVRRLAVHVEDHPLEYGSFEGAIPKGEYGAGEVRIFDRGTYETLEWTEKKVTVRLRGERLRGEYHLINTDDKNWLVFRAKQAGVLARPAAPPQLEPMLASAGGKAFDSPDWVFEPKWDGVRTLALIDGENVRLLSRRGRDVTTLYGELAGLAEQLSGSNALVDGEIVALDEKGRPSFERLQNRFSLSKPSARVAAQYPVEYVAFDLLWLDGESLSDRPLEERRALLERHLVPGRHVQISLQIPERGEAFFGASKQRGLEGIIAKRLGSKYLPGRRTRDWVKIKALNRQDCVIVGWAPGEGRRSGTLGALVLGAYRKTKLIYIGHVGTGFTDKMLDALMERLRPLEVSEPPVPPPPRAEVDLRGVRWVTPELVCEVEYLELTSQDRLRAPSFKGLRPDKVAEDCQLEPPAER